MAYGFGLKTGGLSPPVDHPSTPVYRTNEKFYAMPLDVSGINVCPCTSLQKISVKDFLVFTWRP